MIRCNNCMKIFEDDEHLPVLKNESGEEYAGCDKCNTDAYLMDMDEIMIESIYYVFYKLREELGISLMGKELSSDTIYTAIDRVNIPLLNKDCLQVKRAGEAWEIQGFNISGMNIRVTIDTQGIHISI